MKAMIFAAGTGSRLKPLTDHTPKRLYLSGQTDARTRHTETEILRFRPDRDQYPPFRQPDRGFSGGEQQLRCPDRNFGRERLSAGYGGGIKKATSLCGNEPFLIHNVDILSNVDLKKLYDTHVQTNPLATLLVSQRNTSRYLLFNKENRLCGWRNHETGEVKSYYPYFDPDQHNEYAFSGIHVLAQDIGADGRMDRKVLYH